MTFPVKSGHFCYLRVVCNLTAVLFLRFLRIEHYVRDQNKYRTFCSRPKNLSDILYFGDFIFFLLNEKLSTDAKPQFFFYNFETIFPKLQILNYLKEEIHILYNADVR